MAAPQIGNGPRRRGTRIAAACLLACLAIAAAGREAAALGGYQPLAGVADWERRWVSAPARSGLRMLAPRLIAVTLQSRGYRDVEIGATRGVNYLAEAQNPQGHRVQLVVDGETAEVTGERIIGWSAAPPGAKARRAWSEIWSSPRW